VLPDGQSVPMWGYTCDAASVTAGTCVAANPNAGTNWSPVVITVPYTESAPGVSNTILTISLTNNLSFAAGPHEYGATSLVIVGQRGRRLGAAPVTTRARARRSRSDLARFGRSRSTADAAVSPAVLARVPRYKLPTA